ncbi:MAG: ribosome biogenesis GTP-binding protein YihA/YsxC [Pseudomonadota bacterium]
MNLRQQLTKALFYTSASSPDSLPEDIGNEVAFAGRSNAGKSSAINKLCSQKSLARTSKTPGRTQLINFFTLSETNKLVDLPGYGYAKASQSKQQKWIELLEYYFAHRQSLRGTVILMDIRHPFQDADLAMIDWCSHHQCELHILLNKVDKLSRNQSFKQLKLAEKQLSNFPKELVSAQLFSAANGTGMDELIKKLEMWFDK